MGQQVRDRGGRVIRQISVGGHLCDLLELRCTSPHSATHEVFAPDGFTFEGAHSLVFWSLQDALKDLKGYTDLDKCPSDCDGCGGDENADL